MVLGSDLYMYLMACVPVLQKNPSAMALSKDSVFLSSRSLVSTCFMFYF